MPKQNLIYVGGINSAHPKDRSQDLYDEMIKRQLAKQAAVEGGELPDLPVSPLHQYDLPQPAQPIQSWFAERMMSQGGNYNPASMAIEYMKGKPTLTNSQAGNLGILANPTGKRE